MSNIIQTRWKTRHVRSKIGGSTSVYLFMSKDEKFGRVEEKKESTKVKGKQSLRANDKCLREYATRW